MSKVKVAAFTVSLDGFGAGPRQDVQNPLGVRGEELHSWFVDTDVFKKMNDQGEGSHGIDNDFAAQSMDNIGAWILGRTCSGRCAVSGKTSPGRAGGGIIRRITPGICSHASRARAAYHGRRHDLLLCHRWHRVGLNESESSGQRQRRSDWWRRCHDSPVPDRRPHR